VLVIALNPGHDGAVAVVDDRKLLFSVEGEKDSFPRHSLVKPTSILSVLERLDAVPDLIAVGGWHKGGAQLGMRRIGVGYRGANVTSERDTTFLGQKAKMFYSSHTRSHIMMGAGLAPPDDADRRAVLVWEGEEGTFYLLDERWQVVQEIPILQRVGARYAMVFSIANPQQKEFSSIHSLDDSGKLMALSAFGDAGRADESTKQAVEQLLAPSLGQKQDFSYASFFNAGVQSEPAVNAAALITERIFEVFADAAREHLPAGIPLYISGGCGLNCDWNMRWRELEYFSSVFVPPCTNDSGSAVGTALDAVAFATGDPRVEWNVYCGLDFEWDVDPADGWRRRKLDNRELAASLAAGHVVAWVQGRWEMGPRALGNRSLLAEPTSSQTRDRLNEIKQREEYRPIAPCARLEDASKVFSSDMHDPYMLYFRHVTSPDLGAVTHVDGSARVQTVTAEENKELHDLLSAFAERNEGAGVLCNTSLNFKGFGFINRMSDLVHYCETRGIDDFVVGDAWFERAAG
jgi:hydroxymethyl cephem carbamoyltransferase